MVEKISIQNGLTSKQKKFILPKKQALISQNFSSQQISTTNTVSDLNTETPFDKIAKYSAIVSIIALPIAMTVATKKINSLNEVLKRQNLRHEATEKVLQDLSTSIRTLTSKTEALDTTKVDLQEPVRHSNAVTSALIAALGGAAAVETFSRITDKYSKDIRETGSFPQSGHREIERELAPQLRANINVVKGVGANDVLTKETIVWQDVTPDKVRYENRAKLQTVNFPLEAPQAKLNFERDMRAASVKHLLGLNEPLKQVPKDAMIRQVSVEIKPFNMVGGMATVPMEIASEMPKILTTRSDAQIVIDTPLYTGWASGKFWALEENQGKYSYCFYDANGKKGGEVFKLDLIDDVNIPISGEPSQNVKIFRTEKNSSNPYSALREYFPSEVQTSISTLRKDLFDSVAPELNKSVTKIKNTSAENLVKDLQDVIGSYNKKYQEVTQSSSAISTLPAGKIINNAITELVIKKMETKVKQDDGSVLSPLDKALKLAKEDFKLKQQQYEDNVKLSNTPISRPTPINEKQIKLEVFKETLKGLKGISEVSYNGINADNLYNLQYGIDGNIDKSVLEQIKLKAIEKVLIIGKDIPLKMDDIKAKLTPEAQADFKDPKNITFSFAPLQGAATFEALEEKNPFLKDIKNVPSEALLDGRTKTDIHIKYNLWHNEKFNLNSPTGEASSVYAQKANSASMKERFFYFDKFLYEHLIKVEKENGGKIVAKQDGNFLKKGDVALKTDLLMLHDWHVGPLAALMRLDTVSKQYYGDLPPFHADKIKNTPILSCLHNAGYDGTGDDVKDDNEAHLFNILFEKHALHTQEFFANNNARDLTLSSGQEALRKSIKNPLRSYSQVNGLNMLANFSDYLIPVSEGYANELTVSETFAHEFKDVYKIRTKQDLGSAEDIKALATKNDVKSSVVNDSYRLQQPTLVGINNGLGRVNNIYKPAFKPLVGIDDINFEADPTVQTNIGNAEWKLRNKAVAVEAYLKYFNAHKEGKEFNPLTFPSPDTHPEAYKVFQETSLDGVTVDTPVFVTAGRIVTQKGYEIFLGAVRELCGINPDGTKMSGVNVPDPEKYDWPVFIIQGRMDEKDDYTRSVIQEVAKVKKQLRENGFKKAADRIIITNEMSRDYCGYTILKFMADFNGMASIFEPCGLTHKEFQLMSGCIPVGNKTGGIAAGLEDGKNIICVDYQPQGDNKNDPSVVEAYNKNAKSFAEGVRKALDVYQTRNEKDEANNKYGMMVKESRVQDPDWVQVAKDGNGNKTDRFGGSATKYLELITGFNVVDKKVLKLPQ